MRENHPVTRREYELPDGATLLSTTDTHSHIVYANAAFLEVSGFSREELAGQPHNIVRHPDMPQEAFADMWNTLRSGRTWTALVKNRRKNGDHYWVRANAAPVVRAGQTTGYMSVRTKPTRQEIDAAESLYRGVREGTSTRYRFHQGLLLRTGILGLITAWIYTMPIRWRLRLSFFGVAAAVIAAAYLAGLTGTALAGFACGTAAVCAGSTRALELQIARPLEQVLSASLSVATGQPGETRLLKRVDEIGMILRAVNQAGLNLRSLVGDVNDQVGGIRTASNEIAQGNSDLSERTEKTASNLQETAASMEQTTTALQTNADTAFEAARLARETTEATAESGRTFDKVVEAMQQISASSTRIADIVDAIDGIAFQTNILALNAAVEAARAGAHGKGFAVVAGEVRVLAQRCAEAAREIAKLIGGSADVIRSGSDHVSDAGQAISGLSARVARVSDLVAQISTSTQEQSNGLGEISTAVSQIDQMTQQNAALVEQTSAAAESMKKQSGRLAEAISVFR